MKPISNPILNPMVDTMSSLKVMAHEWCAMKVEEEVIF